LRDRRGLEEDRFASFIGQPKERHRLVCGGKVGKGQGGGEGGPGGTAERGERSSGTPYYEWLSSPWFYRGYPTEKDEG